MQGRALLKCKLENTFLRHMQSASQL